MESLNDWRERNVSGQWEAALCQCDARVFYGKNGFFGKAAGRLRGEKQNGPQYAKVTPDITDTQHGVNKEAARRERHRHRAGDIVAGSF